MFAGTDMSFPESKLSAQFSRVVCRSFTTRSTTGPRTEDEMESATGVTGCAEGSLTSIVTGPVSNSPFHTFSPAANGTSSPGRRRRMRTAHGPRSVARAGRRLVDALKAQPRALEHRDLSRTVVAALHPHLDIVRHFRDRHGMALCIREEALVLLTIACAADGDAAIGHVANKHAQLERFAGRDFNGGLQASRFRRSEERRLRGRSR